MFVDEVEIKVEAGNGGDGCTAFRREKYIEQGGPYGGNGGHGGDIIFKVDQGLHTLLDLRYQKVLKAKKGENGRGKNQNGKGAEPLVIKVPQGTVVTDLETGLVLADLSKKDQEEVIAKGGRGGRGNTAFKTQTNTAPDYSENGEEGEKKTLKVEVKLLADVGLVGLPSVGKSTIISVISKSKPKIAAYHFTTLSPNLGVTKSTDGRSFVVADLPGLIEGASHGEGLGDKFLRHIERTKVIAHVIDMSGSEMRNPYEDYLLINKELEEFNPKLLKKPQIIIANKMDLDGAKENLEEFKKKVDAEIFEISAATHTGLQKVVDRLADLLDEIPDNPLYEDTEIESHFLYKFKKEEPYTITRDSDGTWVISGKEVERIFKMTKFNSEEAIYRFAKKLRRLGIDAKLESLGATDGDQVRILDFYFDYKD
ncbi:MAG: GTPase ObgE [Bacilli bacterium]|nr:GTPase ObgE [Mycoplasmatota bacterium]MDD6941686.1 GTPase ObgE [bacterium]MDY2697077.1 GTPase ObgE [Bacilli bacterium]MDY5993507.1 GTPase ObgE [Bacilli bacterium]MEE0014739.1 GTPase ObgE [Bacilli bacterium]